MMTIFEIEKLIADFYEGKTSVDQEKEIMHFFETQEVPPHLLAEKELFLEMYSSCKDIDNDIEVPAHLEKKLSLLIDTWEEKEKIKKPRLERRIITGN